MGGDGASSNWGLSSKLNRVNVRNVKWGTSGISHVALRRQNLARLAPFLLSSLHLRSHSITPAVLP